MPCHLGQLARLAGGFLGIAIITLAEDCGKPDLGSPSMDGDPEKYHLYTHTRARAHARTREFTHAHTLDVHTQPKGKHRNPAPPPSQSSAPPQRVGTCGSAGKPQVS